MRPGHLIALCSLLIALPAAAATPQTDTVGGTANDAFGSGSFKLAEFQTNQTVELQEIEFYLEPGQQGTEVVFVVYVDPGGFGGWDLAWDSGPVAVTQGLGFKSSGAINQILPGGRTYGIGVFIPEGEDITYFYEDVGGQNLGWAVVDGAYWTGNGNLGGFVPPDPAFGQGSNAPYHQRVTVGIGDDADGDGAGEFDDCDDNDPTVRPGIEEACDGVDNNCNGEVDENVQNYDVWPDTDGDGFGNPDGEPLSICEPVPPPGYSELPFDCDDTNNAVYPDAEEICDGLDNDCDGVRGPNEGTDEDLDGSPVCADCDDTDPLVYPGRADDPCNGKDNDCDGKIPESDAQCDPLEAGEGVIPACACDSGTGSGFGWLLVAGAAAIRRRR